ncbi:MAG: amidohydrolase family protein, partial [Kofleriaceae bacterium]
MRTLIKDGTVVSASDSFVADVWVEDGKIVGLTHPSQRGALAAGDRIQPGHADQTIDAAGQYVIPGGIDCHTHMEMPFGGTNASDDFETGTIAAAHGGTTTIVDFAIQSKGSSMRAGLDSWF